MTEQPGRDYCAEALKSAGMKPNGRARSGGDDKHGEPQSDGQTALLGRSHRKAGWSA
jgi:hypothetical protein